MAQRKIFIMFLHFPKNRNPMLKIANDKICLKKYVYKKEQLLILKNIK